MKKIRENNFAQRKLIYGAIIFLFFLVLFFCVNPVLADSTTHTSSSLVPCTDNCNLCDIVVGINKIFTYLGTILAVTAALFIVIAGIAYMVSGGNKTLIEWAKKALMYALIGFALYLCSWLIVSSILTAMGYNRSGWSTFNCESKEN